MIISHRWYNNMKSRINVSRHFVFLFFLTLLSLNTVLAFTAQGEDNTIPFPDITLTTTADITLDTSASVYSIEALRTYGEFVPHGQIGIHSVYKDKIGKTHVVLTLEYRLEATEADQDSAVSPAVDKEGQVASWMLEKFLALGSNFIENSTDQTAALGWNITTDFNANSYQYALIDGMRSYGSGNVSLVVSYCDSLTGDISDADDTTNVTVHNEYMASGFNWWWRLDHEATNVSRPYILHMQFSSTVAEGYYVFSLPADQDFVDSRYVDIKVGSDSAAANLTTVDNTWEKILARADDYQQKWTDNIINGVGWEDADDVKDSLYEAWATLLDVSIDEIDSYNITEAWINTLINSGTAEDIYDTYKDEKTLSSDFDTYVTETKEETLRTVTVTSEVTPNVLSEDDNAEDITDVTNAALASAVRSAGKSTSFSTKVLDWLITSTGKISKPIAVWMAKARATLEERGISDNWILIGSIAGALGLGAIAMWLITKYRK